MSESFPLRRVGAAQRKKVSWSPLSSPQCGSSKKLRFSSLSGIRPMKKRSHTQLLLCKHNASMDHFFLVRSAAARKTSFFLAVGHSPYEKKKPHTAAFV